MNFSWRTFSYYQIKRIGQNFYEGTWSEEIKVTPDGNMVPEAPLLQAIIRKDDKAIVCFEPVKKAIGYSIQYRQKQARQWLSVNVNEAQIAYFLINSLDKNQKYDFRMQLKSYE